MFLKRIKFNSESGISLMTSVQGSSSDIQRSRRKDPESAKTPTKINSSKSPSRKLKDVTTPPKSPNRTKNERGGKTKEFNDEVKDSTEVAAGDSKAASIENAKKAKEATFNTIIAYLEKKIMTYFEVMTEIQKQVYNEYKKDENFKFYRLENMKVHVEVCHFLATQWARTDIKNLYHKALDFYLQKVYPACSSLPENCKTKVAEYGRILTGIAFVNGDYYAGLTCAVSVLQLLPLDTYLFVTVAKWSCRLREFDIFHKYDNLPLNYPAEVNDVRNVCRLFSEFFTLSDVEKQLEIVDKLIVINNELRNSKEKTFFGHLCLELIYNLLGHASKLPMMNVDKYGDIIDHFSREISCSLTILSSRYKEFRTDNPIFIYNFDKIPDSCTFLKSVMSIPDFCDTQISFAKLMFQTGSVVEAENNLLFALYRATIFAAPFRVIQPLNALYYLKFRTINDKDKLKALGAMIALLLGKLTDYKNTVEPYSRFRNDLLNDTYLFPAKSDSESVLNKTLVTSVTSIPEHLPECDCFLCVEIANNGCMYAEKQYSELLIDGLSVDCCNEFYSNVAYFGNQKFKKRKALLFQIALNIPETEKQKKAALSLLTYICEASTHCILINKNIGGHSKEKLCKNIITCSAYYHLELRYYYLIGRQFKRKTYSLDAYFWLNAVKPTNSTSNDELCELRSMFQSFNAFGIAKNGRRSPPKSPSREVLASHASIYTSQGKTGIGISGMTEEERDSFNQARMDFKSYQHLFFSEWRRRLCHYLGSYLAEEYPWYAAWYFLESRAITLRQRVRLRNKEVMEDLRFKDIVEFKAAVRALPIDFTLVQLFVDEQNVLWLVRCGYDLIPIVLPLTKTNVGKDDISQRMYSILLENDQSVEGIVQRSKFWNLREQLNIKLDKLISDVEYTWLDKFRILLMPFGKINSKLQKYISAAKKILLKAGFSEERGRFLARMFIHAYQDDYKYLLSVFSFVERETFGTPVDAKLQNQLYRKLLEACPESVFQKYLNEDRYTVLIVSPELSCYPWESLPIFRSNPYVLRIQSFHFFDRLTKKTNAPLPLNANSKDSFYVLNPSGDLKTTEKRIAKYIDLDKVNGVKGEHPTPENFLEILQKNDFFLYIGHGSGSRYVGASTIRRAICKSVAILMGCSSVRIEDEGHGFDGNSAVNDYAIAGAPCTIGCLWMVTDGEIDRFLISFVEQCFTEWSKIVSISSAYKEEHKSEDGGVQVTYPYRLLIRAVVRARQACRLTTLTGGSVVVYGIPVLNHESSLQIMDNIDDSVIILDDN